MHSMRLRAPPESFYMHVNSKLANTIDFDHYSNLQVDTGPQTPVSYFNL